MGTAGVTTAVAPGRDAAVNPKVLDMDVLAEMELEQASGTDRNDMGSGSERE